jgi:hypothetical protein
MPNDWRALVLLSRPREVFMSSAAKGELVLTVALFSFGLGVVFLSFIHNASWSEFRTLVHNPQNGLLGLLWLTAWVYFSISSIREWFVAWAVLRDGELTTGVLTDWHEGRSGTSISYQFWTDSGQRFERHGKVFSNEELTVPTIQREPLKVFYIPEDPTKSVALCCTPLRIRLP